MKRITKIEVEKECRRKLRVAAFARVSTASDEQLVSLETQKNHYERYIKARLDWEFAGLYYDEGVTGTKKEKRDGLLNMLADCDKGLHQTFYLDTFDSGSGTTDRRCIPRQSAWRGCSDCIRN